MAHLGIKAMLLPFVRKNMQHLASSGEPGFVHALGTEDEKGEVQMGAEREEKELGRRSNCEFKQGKKFIVSSQRTT